MLPSAHIDAPGTFHHVTHRGVARRPILEDTQDSRYSKVLPACVVGAGRLRPHAFSLMSIHYHVLLENWDGHIGESMRRIQALYVARFNRTRTCEGRRIRSAAQRRSWRHAVRHAG
jgi:hypothetical protein